jgi:hypothetical protein
MDHVGYASGLNTVTTGSKLVVHVLELRVEHFNLVADLMLLCSVSTEALDFNDILPLVEVANGVAKHVVLGCRAVDEIVEP